MSEEMIVRHCSPTLAGLKTGNLFPCSYSSTEELHKALRVWNQLLSGKGVRVLPLRYENGRALIYVYRPSRLVADLGDERAKGILNDCGYGMQTPGKCLGQLMQRMRGMADFPHEIGLFLGYPPEDVDGFIGQGAKKSRYVGCWKVYGDVEKAQKTFAKYKKCTRVYCDQYAKGRSLSRLTVQG